MAETNEIECSMVNCFNVAVIHKPLVTMMADKMLHYCLPCYITRTIKIGGRKTLRELVLMSDCDEDDVKRAVMALVRARVLRKEGEGFVIS